jgi:hypothetical protein
MVAFWRITMLAVFQNKILSAPFYRRCVAFGGLSRSMSTENDLNPSLLDPIQEKPMDPILLKEGASVLASDRLEIASKFPILLHKMVGQICRELSPQASFEFRLQSRIHYRHVPCCVNTSPVEKGIAYNVTDADWLSLDREEIRKFVEDDNRYKVDWGNFFDFDFDTKSGTIVFMPKDQLPHMGRLTETKDSLASDPPARKQYPGKSRKRYYSPFNIHCPTDPQVEKRAELLCDRAYEARRYIVDDFFKQMEGVWAVMSPKDAFISRFESWSNFRGGLNFEEVDEEDAFYAEDDEEYFPEFEDDDDDNIGTVFHINDAHYDFPSKAFKEFLQSDNRYTVHWGRFEPKLTWCGHKYRGNDFVRGFVRFMPKSVKPKRKKLKSRVKNDEIDDEEDDDKDDMYKNEGKDGKENEDTDEEEDDGNENEDTDEEEDDGNDNEDTDKEDDDGNENGDPDEEK